MSRRDLDAYYTPDDLAEALVATLPISRGDRVVEPSAGGGAFVRALLRRGAVVHAIDVDPSAAGLREAETSAVGDFLAAPLPAHEDVRWTWADWVVGNPPFSGAEDHVRRSLCLAPNVAMLLRLAFLESRARVPFWRAHPASEVHVLAERPSFTGGQTDSCAYGWFVWDRNAAGPTTLHVLSWRTR